MREVPNFHSEAEVRLVAAVVLHRFGERQTGERRRKLRLRFDGMDEFRDHALDEIENIFALDEAHFQVELGKFRLAVGAGILIAEAFDNLEVPLHAADHEELFQLLGRLRQSIELAGVQPARHKVIAGPFRRALDEYRRFDFDKVALIETIADELHNMMTQDDIVPHLFPAQIEVAVGRDSAFLPAGARLFPLSGRHTRCGVHRPLYSYRRRRPD